MNIRFFLFLIPNNSKHYMLGILDSTQSTLVWVGRFGQKYSKEGRIGRVNLVIILYMSNKSLGIVFSSSRDMIFWIQNLIQYKDNLLIFKIFFFQITPSSFIWFLEKKSEKNSSSSSFFFPSKINFNFFFKFNKPSHKYIFN